MGKDSSLPYLKYNNKWVILLALTSNSSSESIQKILNSEGENFYESVIKDSLKWSNKSNMMYVVGANRENDIKRIRKIIPNNFILIPGVGAQGGDLEKISINSMNNDCGIIVNISRSIIYADSSEEFAQTIREKTLKIQNSMSKILKKNAII